jgi:hypothetical protein
MLITSAGIFGYLSNAFQAQSLQLQQVDREIAVHQTKIDQNTSQITQLSTQITEFNSNQGKILDGGKVNSRLIRSIDNRDKQITKINDKISDLQNQNAEETEKINQIKISNLGLEKEVGGFRFVAEAFNMELKNVVKFFIFLIVIVFDPLAVALIIAFNGLVTPKIRKEEENLTENVKLDEPIRQDSELLEKIYQVYGDSGKNLTIEEEPEVIVENNPQVEEPTPVLNWEEFMHPEFNWSNKKLWINNPRAVNFWLNSKGGNVRELSKMKNEEENIKTY